MGSNPGRSGRKFFFSRLNFLCRLLIRVRSTPRYRSGTWLKSPVSLPNMEVAGYAYPRMHPSPHEVGVGYAAHVVAWNVSGKWAYMQLVKKPLSTVVSARWATVDCTSIVKSGIAYCWAWADFTSKKKKSAGWEWFIWPSPKSLHARKWPSSHNTRCTMLTLWLWQEDWSPRCHCWQTDHQVAPSPRCMNYA